MNEKPFDYITLFDDKGTPLKIINDEREAIDFILENKTIEKCTIKNIRLSHLNLTNKFFKEVRFHTVWIYECDMDNTLLYWCTMHNFTVDTFTFKTLLPKLDYSSLYEIRVNVIDITHIISHIMWITAKAEEFSIPKDIVYLIRIALVSVFEYKPNGIQYIENTKISFQNTDINLIPEIFLTGVGPLITSNAIWKNEGHEKDAMLDNSTPSAIKSMRKLYNDQNYPLQSKYKLIIEIAEKVVKEQSDGMLYKICNLIFNGTSKLIFKELCQLISIKEIFYEKINFCFNTLFPDFKHQFKSIDLTFGTIRDKPNYYMEIFFDKEIDKEIFIGFLKQSKFIIKNTTDSIMFDKELSFDQKLSVIIIGKNRINDVFSSMYIDLKEFEYLDKFKKEFPKYFFGQETNFHEILNDIYITIMSDTFWKNTNNKSIFMWSSIPPEIESMREILRTDYGDIKINLRELTDVAKKVIEKHYYGLLHDLCQAILNETLKVFFEKHSQLIPIKDIIHAKIECALGGKNYKSELKSVDLKFGTIFDRTDHYMEIFFHSKDDMNNFIIILNEKNIINDDKSVLKNNDEASVALMGKDKINTVLSTLCQFDLQEYEKSDKFKEKFKQEFSEYSSGQESSFLSFSFIKPLKNNF